MNIDVPCCKTEARMNRKQQLRFGYKKKTHANINCANTVCIASNANFVCVFLAKLWY